MATRTEKRWDGGSWTVESEHVALYAAATLDDASVYPAIAPPMFHVRLMKPLLFQIMQDPELDLDFLRLVHASHAATFHHPLHPGDRVTCQGRLKAMVEKTAGLLVISELAAEVDGSRAVTCETTFFIRKPVDVDAPRPTRRARATGKRPAPDFEGALRIPDDASYRYAEASLDDNPIHVDVETARQAGFEDVILQGLCTMAITGAEATRQVAAGDPRRLHHLAVRFSLPVHNGSALKVHGWNQGDNKWSLETIGSDGKPVITAAKAHFHP